MSYNRIWNKDLHRHKLFNSIHCDWKTLYREDGSGNATTAGCCHPPEGGGTAFFSLLCRWIASSVPVVGSGGGVRISGDRNGITVWEEAADGWKGLAETTISSWSDLGARFCSLVGDLSLLDLLCDLDFLWGLSIWDSIVEEIHKATGDIVSSLSQYWNGGLHRDINETLPGGWRMRKLRGSVMKVKEGWNVPFFWKAVIGNGSLPNVSYEWLAFWFEFLLSWRGTGEFVMPTLSRPHISVTLSQMLGFWVTTPYHLQQHNQTPIHFHWWNLNWVFLAFTMKFWHGC